MLCPAVSIWKRLHVYVCVPSEKDWKGVRDRERMRQQIGQKAEVW